MNQPCSLSLVTQKYLAQYRRILEDMIQNMTSPELTDSIARNFILQMIPHHRAAIEMSQNLLRFTTLVPLQNIALNIARTQTQGIEAMASILPRCSRMSNSPQALDQYLARLQRITHQMFCEMERACSTNNINANFLREMIPHHRGAVEMSQSLLRFPICQELAPIACRIISTQKAGIRQMECLLKRCC